MGLEMTVHNTTKKPHFVIGLALVVLMSFIGTSPTNANSTQAQSSTVYETIPDDKTLERDWKDWKDKYAEDELHARENVVKEYIDSLKNSPSRNNMDLARDLTVIYNFHTIMIVEKDHSQEVLALIIARQRANNEYSAEESSKQFHDWLVSKYSVPTKISEIDSRLRDMGYDRDSLLVTQVADAYNSAAKMGIIPYELFAEDPSYWGHASFLSFCKSDEKCSFGKTDPHTKTIDANTDEAILGGAYTLIANLYKILDLQKAYATTHYSTYFFYQMTPSNDCIEGLVCPIVKYTIGAGPVTLWFDSDGKHARGSGLTIYSVAYDYNDWQSGNNVELNVRVDGYHISYNCIVSESGTGYISTNTDCSIPGYTKTTTWTFFIDGEADTWS